MATFLLEVGTEELPVDFIEGALAQWQTRIPATLAEAFLTPETLQVFGTPRRLAVLIEGLPLHQDDRTEEIKGPPAQAAFKDGKPTPAAEGFARKQGVALESLEVRPTPKGEFVFVNKTIAGKATAEILSELAPAWILGLDGKRLMRWGDGDLRFPRPIRWLVALLDQTLLPLRLENGTAVVCSDRYSQGHRVLHPNPVPLQQAQDYCPTLAAAFVLVDPQQRQTRIREQIEAAAQTQGGVAQIPPALLQEVTHLVEWPTAVTGRFDPRFLDLPPEVITTVMISHQRYFPVLRRSPGRHNLPEGQHTLLPDVFLPQTGANHTATHAHDHLLPVFITISNGDPAKSAEIGAGNERVIRARLADGEFFYKTDCSQPLAQYLSQLEHVTFEESLGSMAAKVDRIVKIANQITDQLQTKATLDQEATLGEQRYWIQRAAQLCKADLVTQMVYEFPELQGVMGEKYARVSGEPEAVATAMFEHYLPRGAGDDLPQSLVSQVVALADRLDSLVSIFGLGRVPTGSSDPFALRRAANGVVNILWAGQLPVDLQALITQITGDFHQTFSASRTNLPVSLEDLRSHLQSFFLQRIRTLLQEEQAIDYDLVNAVLGEEDPAYTQRALTDLLDLGKRARFLQTIRDNGQLEQIYETVNRSTRLAAQGNLDFDRLDCQGLVDPDRFVQPTEQAFYDALVRMVPKTQSAQVSRDYGSLFAALLDIAPQVSAFFDGEQSVLIMDPDPAVRQNRLNLLGLLRNHARVLADFGAIVKGAS